MSVCTVFISVCNASEGQLPFCRIKAHANACILPAFIVTLLLSIIYEKIGVNIIFRCSSDVVSSIRILMPIFVGYYKCPFVPDRVIGMVCLVSLLFVFRPPPAPLCPGFCHLVYPPPPPNEFNHGPHRSDYL